MKKSIPTIELATLEIDSNIESCIAFHQARRADLLLEPKPTSLRRQLPYGFGAVKLNGTMPGVCYLIKQGQIQYLVILSL